MNTFQIEEEENYKDLFDSAHDLIHIVHLDGRIIYVNRSWMSLLGFSLEEAIGKSVYDIIAPEERDSFEAYRKSIINHTNDKSQKIVTFISKSGKRVALEGSVFLKEKDGVPLYTRGIFRDISQRLQQEHQLKLYNEELKEREDNLQRLLMNAPDAVIVINQDGIITFWSAKSESLFGWKSEEVLGKSLAETIVPHKYRAAHAAGMNRYLSTGEAHVLNKTIEITALNKAGREFYISLTISLTQQKNKSAFIAFLRDISDQKQNEAELKQKTQELVRSNKKLEQFAHIASHDMKEPIRKIRVFNRMVIDLYGDLIPEAGMGYLHKVEKSIERLYNMVEGVLRYATVEGKSDPVTLVDANAVLNIVIDDLELVIKEKKAVIDVSRLPTFEGVPLMIYQLFYNLVNNALKFSRPDQPPVIKITGAVLESEKEIEIAIQDSGIGFSQDHAVKIFGTFARLHSKDKYEGTGLGLSLCKEIIERHHGSIWARSQLGEGATFFIRLPVQQSKL